MGLLHLHDAEDKQIGVERKLKLSAGHAGLGCFVVLLNRLIVFPLASVRNIFTKHETA